MKEVRINTVAFSFIGLFPYEEEKVRGHRISPDYEPLNIYAENKNYFDQKYYSNWIQSFFRDALRQNKTPTNLKLKASSALFQKELKIEVEGQNDITFKIREIDLFFFEASLGIFVIKVDLPKVHSNWKDLVRFGAYFRKSTINEKYQNHNLSIEIIEEYISSRFHSERTAWRQYNPLLKSAIFIDVAEDIDNALMSHLLYHVGTFSLPFDEGNIFSPDPQYQQKIVDENAISPFLNWKALCLYDSVSRIAVNLNDKDAHKLWENEYILIYVYVLYTRYFLHYTNNQLTQIFQNSKLVEDQRNKFYNFKNQFNHAKISYKFLPNIIYEKLRSSLDIKVELDIIEEKLTRVNVLRQEKYQSRVNSILFLLTVLTLISVAYDGGEMLEHCFEGLESLDISMFIITFCSLIMILLFYTNIFKRK
ncbi:MAG: hypothetical protein AAGA77_03575 [Bacteroidota bacterium]